MEKIKRASNAFKSNTEIIQNGSKRIPYVQVNRIKLKS